MKKAFIVSLLMLIFCNFSSVHAQTIVWVSEWRMDSNSIPFDQGWIDLLEIQGYAVIADTADTYEVLDTAKITALDKADLVIISRNTNSAGYIDGGEISQWNSIDTPLILFNAYLTRSNRWQWINRNRAEEFLQEQMLQIVETEHDIFKSITDDNGQIDMIDETVNDGLVTFIASDTVGNGTVLAKRADDNYVWIAEWEAGIEFYPGTSQKPVEKRMFFATGGSAQQESGSLNLTENGKQVFLNSVSYMLGAAEKAKAYYPPNNALDIEYNPILSWIPGISAETHNVFFGSDYYDVKNATIDEPLSTVYSLGQVLDANSFNPGTLDFGKEYYWRVDEVSTEETFKGKVWSFTVEKEAFDIPYAKIIKVTASKSMEGNDPNNTVNGAGLGEDPNFPDAHSGFIGMWAAPLPVAPKNVWIQYDFDKTYKIHDMQVWNYNRDIFTGYGFKDVLVQYSEDGGQTWTDLPDINQFAKANGSADYNPVAMGENNFAFNDVVANSVRITAFNNWGEELNFFSHGYGLSEVRFTYIPLRARKPSIADKAQNVALDTILKWRKGREAVIHDLYIDINETNVNNASINPVSLDDSIYAPNLSLGDTYYWRVDEVNPGMIPDVWEGDVWSFSVPSTILVDGFETGYGDDVDKNAVFLTWIDGENDNDNGAWMGRDDEPYLHTINHSGGHSAPFNFDNAGVDYSEVTADTSDLLNGSDWSLGNPKTLTIWFRGDPNNDDIGDSQLYCKIGGTKVVYAGSIDILGQDIWCQWDIDLTGMNLSNVPSLTIGIETIGSVDGMGTIYLDDIMLTGFESKINYADILIEAENYTTLTEPMEVDSVEVGDTDASGGEYIHVKNGTTASQIEPPTDGIVTYDVDLDGGQYIIWGRVSIEATNQDAFWVKVDGAETNVDLHTSGWCRWNQIPAGADWHWDDVHMNTNNTNETVIWTIPAGTATISVAYRDTDATNPPRLDVLLIVKVGE